jgi:hypothetical protein
MQRSIFTFALSLVLVFMPAPSSSGNSPDCPVLKGEEPSSQVCKPRPSRNIRIKFVLSPSGRTKSKRKPSWERVSRRIKRKLRWGKAKKRK